MSGKTATPTGSALTDTEFFAPLVSAWQPQDDQSTHAAYTASDLMTAEGSATTGEDNTLHLSFTMNHRMALAVIEMPNTVKYKFTDERIPDYAVSPATTFSGIAQPLRVNDGTYRYLVNHATPAPTIEGHYDEGSKEFTITPSGLSTGSYKRYKVDGAVTMRHRQRRRWRLRLYPSSLCCPVCTQYYRHPYNIACAVPLPTARTIRCCLPGLDYLR